MDGTSKFETDFSSLESCICAFRDCMAPAMHLLPLDIIGMLTENGFFTAPASTKFHGAYKGDLLEHSINVTRTLVKLTEDNKLSWVREESPYIIGMFHDICKHDLYQHPVDGSLYGDGVPFPIIDESKWEHKSDTLLKGHGEKSVMLLSGYLRLTMEEILCIRYHMGAFVDQKEWSDYTRAIHACPNVLWTHQADMIAAHILEVDN